MVGTATDQHSQILEDMEFVPLSGHRIKQEPLDTYKSFENCETTHRTSTMSEIDPMNLLEMLVHASADEDESLPENNDSVVRKRSQPSEERWQEWMQGREWLLHDGEDKRQGFCLYCGIKLMVTGYAHIKRHETSKCHEERGENYRIFELSGRWTDDSPPAIKAEPGTNTAHINMKYRRLRQTDALNDFNWQRWLLAHNWLERKGKQGMRGYCKYCRLELGVEFSVDRQRHEENIKHKLNAKLYWRQKNKESNHNGKQEQPANGSSDHDLSQPDDESDGEESVNDADESQMLRGPWYEPVSDSSQYCRCRLCNVRMEKKSFRKHIKTKMHHTNVRLYKKASSTQAKERAEKRDKEIDWRQYTKIHPWLTADPSNGKYAYCTYCEKRFMYGLSIVKRYLHENSASHKQAEAQQMLNTSGGARRESNADSSGIANHYDNEDEAENENGQNDTGDEEEDDDEENGEEEREDACTTQPGSDNESAQQEDADNSAAEEQAEESEEHGATDNENQSQTMKRLARGSSEWFKLYRCYKVYSKNPAYMYCTVCKVPLRKKFPRKKHESSSRHRLGLGKRPIPANEQKPAQRKDLTTIYPWLEYSRNKRYRCKFCRVVLSDKYSRKQHELTKRHIMCAKNYLAQNEGADTSAVQEPATKQTVAKQSMQGCVIMWKSKLPWITYKRKETRENYAFCQYCDQSVFVPSLKFALKHQRSSRHLRSCFMMRRQRQEAKKDAPAKASDESSNGDNEEELARNANETNENSFDWLITKNSKKVGHCKYCKTDVLISGFLKFQHQSSPAHQKAAAAFLRAQKQNGERNAGSDDDKADDDTAVGDGVDVSSEKSAEETGNEPPAKRLRKATQSDSACSLASRLTSTHLEMLNLMRELNESKTRNSNFLQTSPFSIAACLSTVERNPFAVAAAQNSSAIAAAAQKKANTYDLFFQSMCETVKRLPPDLAAESRIKVMQIVYDLESRALQRTQNTALNNSNDPIETPTPSKLKESGAANPKPATTVPTAAAATAAVSKPGLAAKLRQIRRHSTIEFIPVNGHISPFCKET